MKFNVNLSLKLYSGKQPSDDDNDNNIDDNGHNMPEKS